MSPIYLLGCDRCGNETEVMQSFSAELPLCCGERMRYLPTCPAKIEIKDQAGNRTYSSGYKDGYAKDFRRRLATRRQAEVLS